MCHRDVTKLSNLGLPGFPVGVLGAIGDRQQALEPAEQKEGEEQDSV